MAVVLDTIPAPLKKLTISALLNLHQNEIQPQALVLEEEFGFYDQLIREELEAYLTRKDVVSEIDVILEEQRIRRRIGDEFPVARGLMEKFNVLNLQRRRGEYEIQKSFMAQSGTVAQFEALKKALKIEPQPWWKGPS